MTNRRKKSLVPKPYTLNLLRGFTLLEMVVSLGLFTVVIVIGLGALMSMSAAAQKTKSISIVMDNLNFALESMTRSLRTGISYHCGVGGNIGEPADCPNGASQIAFRDSLGRTVVYRLQNGSIERSTDGGSVFLSVTAPEITIESMNFFVDGTTPGDSRQPRALIVVQGTAGEREREQSSFSIETMVTQRFFDS